MSLEKKETPHFTYLLYRREGYADPEKIKREFANFAGHGGDQKDIVLDLSSLSMLTSSEIGAIVRLLSSCKGTARFLRLILNPALKKSLDATNVVKLENLVIYERREQFTEELKKMGKGG